MRALGAVTLLAVILMIAALPLLFGQLMAASLAKLHLDPATAVLLTIAIFVGGLVNIPVKRIVHDQEISVHRLAVYGVSGLFPQMQRTQRETIIAVNLGGCLIPSALAVYEVAHLSLPGLIAAAAVCAVNATACYRMATLIPGIGIVMPSFVPPFIAAALALLLAPDEAALVAFIGGVAGPLIGADLLHLKDIERTVVGMASIGGAGTFDGIVLSGIVAAYLA